MLEKIKRNILITIGFAGLLYLAFTIYADFDNVVKTFKIFNWLWLPVLLLLSFLNYLTRFLKWDYYINMLDVKLRKIDSFSIFMSGLIMSVTPGKFGEVLKSYLVKKINETPISKTAPIVFVERITDIISLILIALIGAYIFDYGRNIIIGVGIFFLLAVVFLSNKKITIPILTQLERIKFLKKYLISIQNAYESSYMLLQPKPLFYMVLISIVSWSFECTGYFIILNNFNADVSIFWASFSYAFATIVGSITMLPGGLGVTEGSLTLLLIEKGYAKDLAVASTFLIRIVTLWFAVLVGIVSVSIYQKRFGRITLEKSE